VIDTLADKLDHMAFYIGSPSSIEPMLKSIASGKIKHWSTGEHENPRKLNDKFAKGAQIKGKHVGEMQRRWGVWEYQEGDGNNPTKLVDKGYLSGHFRWNFTAYKLDRETRDYIYNFWFNDAFVPTPHHIPKRMKELTYGHVSLERKVVPFPDYPIKYDRLRVNTKSYRWVYYVPTVGNHSGKANEVFLCNIGDGTVNTEEIKLLRDLMKQKKSFN
jgi:hypothetical protein